MIEEAAYFGDGAQIGWWNVVPLQQTVHNLFMINTYKRRRGSSVYATVSMKIIDTASLGLYGTVARYPPNLEEGFGLGLQALVLKT